MIEKNEVKRLAEAFLATTKNYLVDVEMKPGNLIVVEIDNDEAVCVDDCAALNRYLEEQLGPEVDDYDLEVGSAGITSPFKILRQYNLLHFLYIRFALPKHSFKWYHHE